MARNARGGREPPITNRAVGVVCESIVTSRQNQGERINGSTRHGKHTYKLIRDWPQNAQGRIPGCGQQGSDRFAGSVYVFQRKDPPVVIFDRDGNYLGCWGIGAVREAHGMKIVDDIVYTTDRPDSVAVSFTLDGKPLMVLGQRGVHPIPAAKDAVACAGGGRAVQSSHRDDAAIPTAIIYVTDGLP